MCLCHDIPSSYLAVCGPVLFGRRLEFIVHTGPDADHAQGHTGDVTMITTWVRSWLGRSVWGTAGGPILVAHSVISREQAPSASPHTQLHLCHGQTDAGQALAP